jgi:hypothetical protein
MINRLQSFFTTHCPICRYRTGVRVTAYRKGDRFLGHFFIHLFECHSCNIKFHAFSLKRR